MFRVDAQCVGVDGEPAGIGCTLAKGGVSGTGSSETAPQRFALYFSRTACSGADGALQRMS